MKKLIKTLVVIMLSITLVACGSNTKKSFEEKFDVALNQLMKADAVVANASYGIGANSSSEMSVHMKVKDISSNLSGIMEMSLNAKEGGTNLDQGVAFIKDGMMYFDFPASEEKVKQPVSYTVNSNVADLIPTKVLISIFNVENEEKLENGVSKFSLTVNEKAVTTLLSLANDFTEIDEVLNDELMKLVKASQIYISFNSDGNFEEIGYSLTVDSNTPQFKIKFEQIGGDVEFELPSTEGFTEIKEYE